MDIKQFKQILLNDNKEYSHKEISELESLQLEYPYFSMATMLKAKIMHNNNDKEFEKHLSFVATNVLSREALYNYIYHNDTELRKKDTTANTPITVEQKKENSTSQADNKKDAKTVAVKSNLHSENTTEKRPSSIDRGSSKNIIEKFIRNNPKINKPSENSDIEDYKIEDFSTEESYDLVSETMAELYLNQGHKEKAILIYEKLILINPEKSAYFAARISKLKE